MLLDESDNIDKRDPERNLDILLIQPFNKASDLYKTDELRAKAFIRRNSAYIKKLILIAAINESM